MGSGRGGIGSGWGVRVDVNEELKFLRILKKNRGGGSVGGHRVFHFLNFFSDYLYIFKPTVLWYNQYFHAIFQLNPSMFRPPLPG